MYSVPRKLTMGLILSGAFLAACGDDVTVTEAPPPVTPTPVVRSVVVSPSSATVTAGSSFTFGAAVDADAGLARTVTWSASGGTGISVDGNGVATTTTAATGVASICAAATAEPTVKGCAQLTVTPQAPPATVAIDRITIGCDAIAITIAGGLGAVPCNINSPVATNNVYGEFQVHVNINRPQGATVSGVTLEVRNGATVEHSQTQTINSDVIAASDDLAAQVSVVPVTFSVQSAAYTKTATAATPRHTNGQKTIRVTLTGPANSNAVAQRDVTFRNPNGFHIETTTSFTGNNANGVAIRQNAANAISWVGGTGLVFQVFPVSYTGVAANTATIVANFGSGGCDQSGQGTRTVATAQSGGVATGTFAYTNGAASGAGNLNAYEYLPGCTALGEVPFANAVDANGNPFINIVLGGVFTGNNTLNHPAGPVEPTLTTAPALRLDNRGPTGGFTIFNTPNGRALGWMNDEVLLAAANTGATSNGIRTASPADAGIGGTVSFSAHTGAGGSTAATCAGAAPGNLPGVTNLSALAETLVPNAYCVVQQAVDLFRNRSLSNVVTVGRDNTAPAVTNNGSPADQTIVDVTAAEAFAINASDMLSGFAAAGAIRHSLIRANGAVGGLARTNVVGSGSITTTPFAALAAGTLLNTPAAAAYVPNPTTITGTPVAIGAAAVAGYYLYQARAFDQAGNASPFFTRRFFANNGNIPAITGLNASLTYTGGAAASFPAASQDGVEVSQGELRLAYPNLGQLIFNRATPVISPLWDDDMPIPSAVPFSIPAFVRGLQSVNGAGALQADFVGAKPNAVLGRVFNPFGTTLNIVTPGLAPVSGVGASGWSADFSAPILSTQVQTGTDFNSLAVAVRPTAFLTTLPAACVTASGFETCTWNATVRGPSGSFINPFSGIAVVEALTGTTDWRLVQATAALGQVALPNLTVTITPDFTGAFPTLDNGVDRDFRWIITTRRAVGAGTFDYRIIGWTTGFDALASVIVTNTY